MVAAFFVTVADDLEEHCSARLIEAGMTSSTMRSWRHKIFAQQRC